MDWQGIRPFADVPKTLNPEQGWIANWNNRSGKGTVSTVEGSPWGSADRVVEIMSRIEAKDRFTPEEVWNILPETSFVDVNARYFVPRILAAGASLPADDPRQPMLAALADWDSRQIRDADGKATSPAVAILRNWMDVMVADVLLDDAPAIPAKVMQIRIALPSALLNNALLGEEPRACRRPTTSSTAPIPTRWSWRRLTRPARRWPRSTAATTSPTWRAPLDQHVFDTKNYLGIPQASADEGLADRHRDEPRHRERHDPLPRTARSASAPSRLRARAASSRPTARSRRTTKTSCSSTPTSAAARKPSTGRTWRSRRWRGQTFTIE